MKKECELEEQRTSIIELFKNQNPDLYSQITKMTNDCNTQSNYTVKVVYSGTEGCEWQTEQK